MQHIGDIKKEIEKIKQTLQKLQEEGLPTDNKKADETKQKQS